MASTAESRYQQPRYGNNQANGGGSGQGQSYVLYPDAPQVPQPTPRKKPQQQDHQQQQQPTPQSSYSSTSSSHHNRSPAPSRGNSGSNGINIAGASPKIKQSQLNYLNSPAVFSTSPSAAAPPSPISPSSPSPIEIMTGHLGRTHLEEPVLDRLQFENYDQKQYQQPRKNSGNSSTQQQRHQQLAQENESYSSGGLKQSGSTGSARSMGSQGRDQNGALRQSPSSGSAYSVGSNGQTPSQRQQQRAMNGELNKSGSSASAHSVASSRSHNLSPSHSTGSATSNSSSHMRQQQSSSTRGAPTSTPSPLAYGHDQGDDKERGDNEDHQKQAFQYQQKLQQKPPSTHGGEDDSDDSDSGSMLSYRRSISRLSISYKRTQGGAPNISLFAPKQRAAMLQGSHSSELSSSQKMIQDQRDERIRQQKLQQYSNGNSQGGNNSSMASIDQYPRQDEGRPSMNRNHSGGNNNQQQYQGGSPQIPDRSTSTEHSNGGNGRPRQQQQQQQQSYPGNGRGHPSSPNIPERQLSNQQHSQQQYSQQPRSNHDQGQGQSSQRSRPNQLNLGQGDHQQDQRSRSPMPSGARTPGLPGQGSTLSSNGGGNGEDWPSSGGYVRPEEAMGPSNPMPEKAEDFVRQGIEYHEVGDIAKATHFFRTAAEMGDPVGMLMYGLSVRHGWGCSSNRQLAFQYLQKSAEHAVGDLKSRDSFASTAAKGELVLAIYELGICFRHGWGADKNKKTAAYYFEIAANLGDPDAQNDLAWCYYHGVGVKKDMFKAAKYYRLAAAQGLETVGNSWIWKDKYGGMPSSPTGDSKAPF
ncbi:hypothetical protein BGX30_014660 [Mortierella sp. GBA39]|nr:hypothetical protein BGX30_014660 [Mortierella sp. GBA39]